MSFTANALVTDAVRPTLSKVESTIKVICRNVVSKIIPKRTASVRGMIIESPSSSTNIARETEIASCEPDVLNIEQKTKVPD